MRTTNEDGTMTIGLTRLRRIVTAPADRAAAAAREALERLQAARVSYPVPGLKWPLLAILVAFAAGLYAGWQWRDRDFSARAAALIAAVRAEEALRAQALADEIAALRAQHSAEAAARARRDGALEPQLAAAEATALCTSPTGPLNTLIREVNR